MRKPLFFFLFAFIFSCSFLQAQNWEVYKSGDRFLYYLNGYGYDTSAVFIKSDSISVSGNDTTFCLNRKVVPTGTWYMSGNKSFPLQKKIIHYSNGAWQLKDTANWILHPLDSLNSSWIFDSIHAINASITRIYYGQVLGQNDSIKTISLTNGDSILISKNHGVLALPITMTGTLPYSLAGYNQSADDSIPGYQRIFDFQAGDIYEYRRESSTYCGNTMDSYVTSYRDSIISVLVDASGIHCVIYRWSVATSYHSYSGPDAPIYRYGTITKNYTLSGYNFLDYNGNHSMSNGFYFVFANGSTFNCKTKYYHPRANGSNGDSLFYTESYGPTHYNSYMEFGEGFGMISTAYGYTGTWCSSTFSSYHLDSTLLGVRKGNVTFNTLHDLSFFYAPPPSAQINPLSSNVSPNPVENFITINASDPLAPAKVEVYDAAGRLVIRVDFTGSTTLSFETLNNGVYFLRTMEGSNINNYKIVHFAPKN